MKDKCACNPHSPAGKNPFQAFVRWFFLRERFFDHKTGVAHCAWCGAELRAPISYYRRRTAILYIAIGIVLGFLYSHLVYGNPEAEKGILRIPVILAATVLLVALFLERFLTALLFTCGKWREYDPSRKQNDLTWLPKAFFPLHHVHASLLGCVLGLYLQFAAEYYLK